MSEFKVGDRVRISRSTEVYDYRGAGGVVTKVDHRREHPHEVRIDGGQLCNFFGSELTLETDAINHPDHYKWLPVEAIEITEHFNFTMGNALKYILRADHKGSPVEDLKKAVWYLQREIANREAGE